MQCFNNNLIIVLAPATIVMVLQVVLAVVVKAFIYPVLRALCIVFFFLQPRKIIIILI